MDSEGRKVFLPQSRQDAKFRRVFAVGEQVNFALV